MDQEDRQKQVHQYLYLIGIVNQICVFIFFRAVNSTISEAIMNVVRDALGSTKFHFWNPRDQARILSGSEEGLFSWITVNYVSGKFGVVGQ